MKPKKIKLSQYDILQAKFDKDVAKLQKTCDHSKHDTQPVTDWWGRWKKEWCINCHSYLKTIYEFDPMGHKCEKSPTKHCVYTTVDMDECKYCGLPEERK
jgi:hypothetical protein